MDDEFSEEAIKEEQRRLNKETRRKEFQLEKKIREDEELKERKEQAIKAMNYLLINSQKYSKYFLEGLKTVDKPAPVKRVRFPLQEKNQNIPVKKIKDIKFDDDEIAELEKKQNESIVSENITGEEKKNNKTATIEIPSNFVGELQPHQVEGLTWLKLLYENGVNGILADEMGLGKTIQVIALVCHLLENNVPGPFLVVAPLSTLPNWLSEFKRFAPKVPVVLFHGKAAERAAKYKEVRRYYLVDEFKTQPVVLTSYQIPLMEAYFLSRFKWQYVIVDEAHRIKNYKCALVNVMKHLNTTNRLLLTGTPLQNNLVELWSLLNFLLPQFFKNPDTFESLFLIEDFQETDKIVTQEQNTNIISTIQGVLGPFMLRRLKSDVLLELVPKKEVLVYCPLTQLQRDLYKFILQRNVDQLLGKPAKSETVKLSEGRKKRKCTMRNQRMKIKHTEPILHKVDTQLQEKPEKSDIIDLTEGREKRKCTIKNQDTMKNEDTMRIDYTEISSDEEFDEDSADIINGCYANTITKEDQKSFICQIKLANPGMMLKKVVNHPFLIHFPLKPGTRELKIDDEILKQSGKMLVLDALLAKLKERGHKVLLFSTLIGIMDFIADYLEMKDYQYCRLDGTHGYHHRQKSIQEFNENPNMFIFLISTRAGGLGLNLTSADTVILFDRDWNPQVDIQAQDRCHRYGQTKPVVVYTFVTKGTIDERIITRANAKRRLEKVVIKKGKFTNPGELQSYLTDLNELKELLNSVDHNQVIQSNANGYVFSDEELNQLLDRSDLNREMEKNK